MKIKIFGGILVAALAITSMANAQTRTPEVTRRQADQEARIHQGVRSGQLTHREANHLQARESKIQRDKMRAKADGRVSPRERAHLRREENRTSRAIYRKKHNLRKY